MDLAELHEQVGCPADLALAVQPQGQTWTLYVLSPAQGAFLRLGTVPRGAPALLEPVDWLAVRRELLRLSLLQRKQGAP